MNINVVTVIGANGTMGCRVSGIFASFGDAKVYMVSRELEAAYKAKAKAVMSVRAEAIASNLIPKTYCDLEECISESDLVFESVAEDISVKKNVYKGFAEYVRPNAIVATGTSGLSVNQLSECFDEKIRRRFVGMHMYNPPYYMTLCEVIPSRRVFRSFRSLNMLQPDHRFRFDPITDSGSCRSVIPVHPDQ